MTSWDGTTNLSWPGSALIDQPAFKYAPSFGCYWRSPDFCKQASREFPVGTPRPQQAFQPSCAVKKAASVSTTLLSPVLTD